ncbi:adenosine deaminase [Corynebacterium bovis]|uniref:adenosine deaminase n=1 Tax=Corynebacterium bovis DSM 20582 = CIP 54.80 TaxID=927655 RepID=A0A8I0CNM9_9CORY|nr:adenosine deaminase [Corynebacterium bovis]MBB3115605.1 adenosine deaminase [Corynebacterium bovis DSM 20582 = CIP 54.80]QQC47319.1 adenosine deaminase [Corynebacterium bovis]RRO78895.1 adenosine deaminase [Corynebacterium bovis]RRO79552.1 adenosine deaminase [Corynebacterium bovis]RRO79583.1 adenosine deaminase [Corynebacterium bovis]
MSDHDVIASLPKVVLHDHLDGGLRPATIIDIARETGYDGLPTTDPDELETWFFDAANSGDLPTYLTTFDHTTAVMQTREALVRVTREAVEDLAADGVCYAELRYAPEQHLRNGLTLQEVVEATVEGVKEGERAVAERGGRIHARLLLCAMRHADRAAEIAQLTVDNHGEHTPGEGYVVGFDIAGAEDGFPPENHREAFRILRENLVPFTVHAGEAAGVESIAGALAQGARRIGHGVRIYEDFEATMGGIELGRTASYVRDNQVPLEVCPTSNTQTGVCDTVADHPFNLLYDTGFTLTVNTDNRLVSGCTMTSEMIALQENFDLEYWQLLEFTTNALDVAFCPQPLRLELEQQVIYPAYAAFGEQLGGEGVEVDGVETLSGAGDDAPLGGHGGGFAGVLGLHGHGGPGAGGHGHGDGVDEMSMDRLKAELEELGLSLDDEADEADGADGPDGGTDA